MSVHFSFKLLHFFTNFFLVSILALTKVLAVHLVIEDLFALLLQLLSNLLFVFLNWNSINNLFILLNFSLGFRLIMNFFVSIFIIERINALLDQVIEDLFSLLFHLISDLFLVFLNWNSINNLFILFDFSLGFRFNLNFLLILFIGAILLISFSLIFFLTKSLLGFSPFNLVLTFRFFVVFFNVKFGKYFSCWLDLKL